MRRISNKNKALVVAAVAAVGIAGAGGAYAFWTTGGAGSGSAAAGSNVDFTIAQTNTVSGLVPDGPQTVKFTVTNPATFAQMLTGVAVTVNAFSAQNVAPAQPACTAADFAISNISIAGGEIPAGDHRDGTAVITLTNKATNQDNCKGAPVALSFVAG
jgi:hypothetical protein